ncbi:hypothetical protein [Pseudomonas sp. FSL R10-1339]|uniref:hypothetical protein n=1 Tax=Pseudomonas sp. FSL R10-1339 TaxID=2662196 RepID=UPI001295B774|nr:hypothetical protein [Pseudomonas sp. FSL R10-1339]MQU55059.1 hypothetical protein [Pseudomonas sp. FSL R10-1339]
MNIFHKRSDALTGLACPKKAFYTPHPDKQSTQDEYVAPVRTYYHVGDQQSVQAGNYGTAIAGDSGNARAGDCGAAYVLSCGTAAAGFLGTAIAGDYGTASVGDQGTASAGIGGTVCAGEKGEIRLKYRDSQAQRCRTVTGYIGENALEPNTPYTLNAQHAFVQALGVTQ